MNPKGFGKLDNHKQEQWKAPLPQFIEHLYMKRFGKEAPDSVLSFEEITKLKIQKKVAAKERKTVRRTTAALSETEDQKQDNSDTPQLFQNSWALKERREGLHQPIIIPLST